MRDVAAAHDGVGDQRRPLEHLPRESGRRVGDDGRRYALPIERGEDVGGARVHLDRAGVLGEVRLVVGLDALDGLVREEVVDVARRPLAIDRAERLAGDGRVAEGSRGRVHHQRPRLEAIEQHAVEVWGCGRFSVRDDCTTAGPQDKARTRPWPRPRDSSGLTPRSGGCYSWTRRPADDDAVAVGI